MFNGRRQLKFNGRRQYSVTQQTEIDQTKQIKHGYKVSAVAGPPRVDKLWLHKGDNESESLL